MSGLGHDQHRENIAPYVLGALPELETALLERHLMGCESCRAEVERLSQVPLAMASAVPHVDPPASLKASLMRTVRAEASPVVAERARSSRRLAGLRPRIALAGSLAMVALGVVVGVSVSQLTDDSSGRTVAAQVERTALPSAAGELALSGDERARVSLTRMPRAPKGRDYQLWIRRGRQIERGPVVRVGGDGRADASIPRGAAGADEVLMTVERAGGAPAPTGRPIMRFRV